MCDLEGWGVRRCELCVCVCVCVCVFGACVGQARLWGRQLLPSWWISWHMQAMNYQATRVNYPKEGEREKKNMDPVPVAPGSLFQFREWFPPKCRGEEKRSRDDEERENEWSHRRCVCPSSHTFFSFLSLSFPPSLHPRSNPEGRVQCENAKGYYQAFRVHERHLWWMSVGFRKASCQPPAGSPT